MTTLSQRGFKCIKPAPEYLVKSFDAFQDRYDRKMNPNGFINLSIAENLLSLPYVAEKLSSAPAIPVQNLTYGNPEHFNRVMASFLGKHILGRSVNPAHIAVLNGATSVLDTFATVLCDEGDRVLTTGPGYRGLDNDVSGRAGAELVTACLEGEGDFERTPAMSITALDNAWVKAGGDKSKMKMAIICSPNNPTGEVLRPKVISDIVRWARLRKIHVIFDEIYARSVHADGVDFVSVLEVLDGDLGDYIHIAWSMSKDFCISGCRIGVLYSQNMELMRSINAFLAFFSMTSRHTQWALEHLLTDDDWVENYINMNRMRLGGAYKRMTARLDEMGVPYMEAEAGFFVWIDLRKWMGGETAQDEMELWSRLLETKVLLTPSSQCFGRRFGYFRVCFTAVEPDTLDLALKRLAGLLSSGCH